MSKLLTKNSRFIMTSNSRFPYLETYSNSLNAAASPSTDVDAVKFLLPPSRRSINTLTSRSLSPSKFSNQTSERRASSAKVTRENSSVIRKPSNSSTFQQNTKIILKKRDSDSFRKSQTEDSPEKNKKIPTDPLNKSKKNRNRVNAKPNKYQTGSNSVNKIQIKEEYLKIRDRSTSPIKWQPEHQPSSPKKSLGENQHLSPKKSLTKNKLASPRILHSENKPSSPKKSHFNEQESNVNNKTRLTTPIKWQRKRDNANAKERLASPKKTQAEIEDKPKKIYETSSLFKWLTKDLVQTERCSKYPLKNGANDSNRVASPIEWTIEDLTDRCRSPKIQRKADRFPSRLKCQLERKSIVLIDRSSSPINWNVPEDTKRSKKRGRSSTPKYDKNSGLSSSRVAFSSTKKNEMERPLKNALPAGLPVEERTYMSRRFRSTSASPKKPEPEKRTKIVYAEEYLKNKRNFRFSAPFRRTTGSQCDRPNRNKAVETSLGTANAQQYGVFGQNNSPCNVYKFLVQLA